MTKFLTEFIGTFFLVFTIGCAVVGGAPGIIAALAIGGMLMVMVYAGGHVSGAHYNPAVTLAIFIRGKCAPGDVLLYWIAQVAGAAAAAAVALYVTGKSPTPGPIGAVGPALVAEFLITFALAYVVLNVATAKSTAGNSFYGVAIGVTVMSGAFAVGPISGGAFNPAVAMAISIMGLSAWSNLWVYLVATFSGAAFAAVVFRLINPGDQ
jgi:aquaporin Z